MLASLQVIILNLVSLKNSESQSSHLNLNCFNSALSLMAKCQIRGVCRIFLISSPIFLAAQLEDSSRHNARFGQCGVAPFQKLIAIRPEFEIFQTRCIGKVPLKQPNEVEK